MEILSNVVLSNAQKLPDCCATAVVVALDIQINQHQLFKNKVLLVLVVDEVLVVLLDDVVVA